MSLREVLADVVVQNKQRFEDGVRAYFGSGEEWSLRYDASAGEFILVDESGPTQALRIPDGQTLSAVLESGGVHELDVSGLSGDLADAQDPKAHASDHYEGGPDAMVLEQLAANSTDDTLVFGPDGAGGVGTSTVSDLGGLAPGKLDSAETFAESDVTTSLSQTQMKNESIELSPSGFFPDDFEDGVDSGWSGDTASLATTTNVVLEGSQSGEFTSSDTSVNVSYTGFDKIIFAGNLQSDKLTSNSSDFIQYRLKDSGGTTFNYITFSDSGDVEVDDNGTTTVVDTWSANTTYKFVVNHDFGAGTYTFTLNGTEYGPFGFSSSDFSQVTIFNQTANSGETRIAYLDSAEPYKSGSVIIEWPYPDLSDWDQALFQRTLDNETVDVYVQEDDGTGFQDIAGPISRGDPITADPSNEVRFRVKLSRSDTNNNPTLDAIYRRYLV